MKIKEAKFVKSTFDIEQLPAPNLPEFAFIGRSNVGKSSLINMLVNRKNLAKTSSKPGKTRSINHFLINNNWYLVDLPGYGYAKTSKKERQQWNKLIFNYLTKRQNLVNLFVLVDSRIEPQAIDIDFINQLGINQIPFAIVFTKTDKLTKNKIVSNITKFKRALEQHWEELPLMFISSAVNGAGREEILDFIEDLIKDYDSFGRNQIRTID